MSARIETLPGRAPHRLPPSWMVALIAVVLAAGGAGLYWGLRGGAENLAASRQADRPAVAQDVAGVVPAIGEGTSRMLPIRKVAWQPGHYVSYWGPNDPDLGFNRVGGTQSLLRGAELPRAFVNPGDPDGKAPSSPRTGGPCRSGTGGGPC